MDQCTQADWTLSKVRAWIVWRDIELAELAERSPDSFKDFEEANAPRFQDIYRDMPPREACNAISFGEVKKKYPDILVIEGDAHIKTVLIRPSPTRRYVGDDEILLTALREGKITARGRHHGGRRCEIPADEWMSGWTPSGWSEITVKPTSLPREWMPDAVCKAAKEAERKPTEQAAPGNNAPPALGSMTGGGFIDSVKLEGDALRIAEDYIVVNKYKHGSGSELVEHILKIDKFAGRDASGIRRWIQPVLSKWKGLK